jgi:hypothetical protein
MPSALLLWKNSVAFTTSSHWTKICCNILKTVGNFSTEHVPNCRRWDLNRNWNIYLFLQDKTYPFNMRTTDTISWIFYSEILWKNLNQFIFTHGSLQKRKRHFGDPLRSRQPSEMGTMSHFLKALPCTCKFTKSCDIVYQSVIFSSTSSFELWIKIAGTPGSFLRCS